MRRPRSVRSYRRRQVRLRSKASLTDTIATAAITLLDRLGLPLVPQTARLLRSCMQTTCVRVALRSAGRLRALLHDVGRLAKVGQLLLILIRRVVLLRALGLHEDLLVPLQAVAFIRAHCAWLESLPGLLCIARVVSNVEHRVVLLLRIFLLELREVRSKVCASILIELLLCGADRYQDVPRRLLLQGRGLAQDLRLIAMLTARPIIVHEVMLGPRLILVVLVL